jgi:hypothetical protein
VQKFIINYNGIKIYDIKSSSGVTSSTLASTISTQCILTTCNNVIRQIKLYFISKNDGTVVIDLTSSYIVVGTIIVPTLSTDLVYLSLAYSY